MWVHLQRLVIGNLPICPTQGLEHTLSAEKMHSINLTENNKKNVWACMIMNRTIIYLLMVQKL